MTLLRSTARRLATMPEHPRIRSELKGHRALSVKQFVCVHDMVAHLTIFLYCLVCDKVLTLDKHNCLRILCFMHPMAHLWLLKRLRPSLSKRMLERGHLNMRNLCLKRHRSSKAWPLQYTMPAPTCDRRARSLNT